MQYNRPKGHDDNERHRYDCEFTCGSGCIAGISRNVLCYQLSGIGGTGDCSGTDSTDTADCSVNVIARSLTYVVEVLFPHCFFH